MFAGSNLISKPWLAEGKTVALTGATGGLGSQLCRLILAGGGKLIMLDRNIEKSLLLEEKLKREFSNAVIEHIQIELEDIESVNTALYELRDKNIDIFIHNAGAYCIPRNKCSTGFDNIFMINFVSPYFLIKGLLPKMRQKNESKVIVVGSIAHNYSKIDENDIDFSSRKSYAKVYGNAKRYLMFSMYELFKHETEVKLAVVHPGITFTNITAHYPKPIFMLIKYPMKLIFMKASKAAKCIFAGVSNDCKYFEWIGPRFFNIWGSPIKSTLKTCSKKEAEKIYNIAENIYKKLKEMISD